MADGQSFFAVVTLLAPMPGGGGGVPTPPIYLPPQLPPGVWPQPPGQQPPGIWGGGNVPMPTPPIYLPGAPSGPGSPAHPIILPPNVVWPPLEGAGAPSHPIVIPPDGVPGGGPSLPIYPPPKPDQGLPVVPPAGAYILVWVVGTSTFKLLYIPATVNPQPPTATPTR
jgi:hypothetical protein